MQKKAIKTLYVTNMYPTPEHPVDGIFIEEQIQDLSKTISLKKEIFLIDSVYKGKKEYVKSLFTIPKIIQSKAFDVIHVHYGISGLFLLFFKPKAKVFLTLHGSDIQKRKGNGWQVWLTRKILSKADQVFVQNRTMEDLVIPYNPNVSIVTCGVDADFFRPELPCDTFTGSKLILFPSSPKREVKNYSLFTKVINRINEKVSFPVAFACIDQLSRSEVRSLLNKADCLLLTSKTEGSPQVVKEALSCNLPVVSVPVGDVDEIMDSVPNCFVAPSHEVEELSDLVIRVLQSKKQNIREVFLKKEKYHHQAIAKTLAYHYTRKIDEELKHSKSKNLVASVY